MTSPAYDLSKTFLSLIHGLNAFQGIVVRFLRLSLLLQKPRLRADLSVHHCWVRACIDHSIRSGTYAMPRTWILLRASITVGENHSLRLVSQPGHLFLWKEVRWAQSFSTYSPAWEIACMLICSFYNLSDIANEFSRILLLLVSKIRLISLLIGV